MNTRLILAGVMVVALGILMIAVFFPDVIPEGTPLIGSSWYATVPVKFSLWPWDPVVSILDEDVVIEKSNELTSWSIDALLFVEVEGTMVVESLKDGVVVDRDTKRFSLGRLDGSTVVTLKVKLGGTDTGEYLIRAVRYKDGEPRWDQTDTKNITI